MPNQFCPMSAVRPEARKLIATPEMSWLPLSVIEAKPCSSASSARGDDAGEKPDPGRAGDRREGAGGEGGGEHLAFEADVEDAGALGVEPGEAGEQQRRREAEAGAGELEEGVEVHQAAFPRRRRKARSTGTRTRFSSAPVKRMTSAWMTTIISRLIAGISKASSAPPW